MLQAADLSIAQNLKKQFRKICPINRLIIFGSRARGNATVDSDLDIFVEVPTLTPEIRLKMFDIAWEISLENGVVISLFLVPSHLLTDGPVVGNPLIRVIETEGVTI